MARGATSRALPKSVVIAGKLYAVRDDPAIYTDEDNLGDCTGRLCRIRLAASHQSPYQLRDTLLHEILHALLYESAIRRTMSPKLEESVVSALAPGL